MKPFSPYKIIKQVEGECIELELPKGNKRLNFFTYRIFPFILLIISINAYFFAYKEIPIIGIIMGIGIPILCFFMFIRKYIISIKINQEYIEFEKRTVLGKQTFKFSFPSIKKIICKIRYGKGGGTYLYVHTINDNSEEFLTIPSLYTTRENTTSVIAEIEKITKIKVEQA